MALSHLFFVTVTTNSNKKFRIKLLSNLQNFMKYPKNNLKSKKNIQEQLENLLKARY